MFGKVVHCLGDTLDQHYWEGFEEGVGVSFQKCRQCLCQFETMQNCFSENDFILVTKELHEKECLIIEQAPREQTKTILNERVGLTGEAYLQT